MTAEKYEGLPRTLRLVEGVRLQGGQFVLRVRAFRGEVQVSSEEVFMSVDDASVVHAQLSRLLNELSFPGLEERRERRRKANRGW